MSSPSGSEAVHVIVFAVCSTASIVWSFAVGRWLTLIVILAESLSTIPSFTLKVNESFSGLSLLYEKITDPLFIVFGNSDSVISASPYFRHLDLEGLVL